MQLDLDDRRNASVHRVEDMQCSSLYCPLQEKVGTRFSSNGRLAYGAVNGELEYRVFINDYLDCEGPQDNTRANFDVSMTGRESCLHTK